jgi:hypothetical protein
MYPTEGCAARMIDVAAQEPTDVDDRSHAIADALASVPDLTVRSLERDRLWFALWNRITTQDTVVVRPANSGALVRVSREFASLELLAAWAWLEKHETQARTMDPVALERTLRNHATRSHHGSGRASMADDLCGITNVPRDIRLTLHAVELLEEVAP